MPLARGLPLALTRPRKEADKGAVKPVEASRLREQPLDRRSARSVSPDRRRQG
jgi:hypothetical protein